MATAKKWVRKAERILIDTEPERDNPVEAIFAMFNEAGQPHRFRLTIEVEEEVPVETFYSTSSIELDDDTSDVEEHIFDPNDEVKP